MQNSMNDMRKCPLNQNFCKGPVLGFVGIIPLPTLESRIIRKHYTGAFLTFLFRFCLLKKTYYVWRVLVLYFKNNNASFREQGFSLQVIFAKHEDRSNLWFLSIKKCIISEGCWFFTLKMTMQTLGSMNFSDRQF